MDAKSFMLGVVIGGVVFSSISYYITREVYKKKKEEEVGSARKELFERYSVQKATEVKEDPEEIVRRYHKEASAYSEPFVDPAETENPKDDDEEDAPSEYYEYGEEIPGETRAYIEGLKAATYDMQNGKKEAEIIFEDDFGNAPGFDTAGISYYVPDGVYVFDSDETIVDDEQYLFGTCISKTKWDIDISQGEDLLIRNYQQQTDYRITKMNCEWPGKASN